MHFKEISNQFPKMSVLSAPSMKVLELSHFHRWSRSKKHKSSYQLVLMREFWFLLDSHQIISLISSSMRQDMQMNLNVWSLSLNSPTCESPLMHFSHMNSVIPTSFSLGITNNLDL